MKCVANSHRYSTFDLAFNTLRINGFTNTVGGGKLQYSNEPCLRVYFQLNCLHGIGCWRPLRSRGHPAELFIRVNPWSLYHETSPAQDWATLIINVCKRYISKRYGFVWLS